MKKTLLVFGLSLIVVVSGYAKSVQPTVAAEVAQTAVNTWDTQNDEAQDTQEQEEEEEQAQNEDFCETCAPEIEEKVPVHCAKKVKTVRYADKCTHGCGFPITVRVESDCSNEGDK